MTENFGNLFAIAEDGELLIVMQKPGKDGPAQILNTRTGEASEVQPVQVFFKWGFWDEIVPPMPVSEWMKGQEIGAD